LHPTPIAVDSVVRAVHGTWYDLDYHEFCARAGFAEDTYAEEKWRAWQQIHEGLAAFDRDTFSRIVLGGRPAYPLRSVAGVDHNHPKINSFNRTGQRFLWSDLPDGKIALYRWDPPAGYTPCVLLAYDPAHELRELMVQAFTKAYPLPCGCAHEAPDASIHSTPVDV
jgi:hypothetical protein